MMTFCSRTTYLFFLGFIFFLFFFILFSTNCLSHPPRVCNLSQTNFFFVGREEELEKVDSFFKKGDKILLAITGAPGFGKTQIAKKYAHTHNQNYDFIWWFDAQQDLPSQFEKLALALNTLLPKTEHIIPSKLSKEALVDMIKNLLRLKEIRYLLVFDNPETYAQVEKFIPIIHSPSGKHVVLTSRNANIGLDKIEIGRFKREDSLSMIKRVLSQEKKEEMIRLANTLGDYPLALSLALRFIASHPTVTVDNYIAMYFKRPLKEKEEPSSPLLDSYPESGLGTLEISMRFIEKESKDSLQTLFFMSLLNSKDIPDSYIDLWLKKTKSSLPAIDAIKHVYGQSLMGVSEIAEFNDNKKLTGQEKMIERIHYLSIHDLIHQLINESIDPEAKKELIEKATTVMLDVFSGTAEEFVKKMLDEPVHLLHAQKLSENAKKIGYLSPNLLKLRVCIFQCLIAPVCNFEGAKLYLEEIEDNMKLGLELDPYYKALLKINKGFFECIYNVNYDEAIRNMTEGLTLLDPFKDYDDGKLRAIANLVQYYTLRGEIEKAEEFINKGKDIFDHSSAISYKSFYVWAWALLLTEKGNFEESLHVLNKAKGLPQLFPSWEQGLLQQRIENYIKQGKLKEAKAILKKYEKVIQEFFQGRKNIALGNALFFKGSLLMREKKKNAEAFRYLKEALTVYKDFFRDDKKHRVQARAHLAMGKSYKIKADFENALKEFLLSKEIYDIVLKEKKIDDISDLYTELALLGTDLKDDGITHQYLTAHIDTFGLDHPRTEKILNHLDHLKLVIPN
jgi:tetratricopeptide (TPR) repeat protein